MKLKIPNDYTVTTHPPSWRFNIYGWHSYKDKTIDIYPPKWLVKPIRNWWVNKTEEHELAHAWGIKGCKHPYCLVFEMETWNKKYKDKWYEKVISFICLPFNCFRFCKEHRQYLIDKGVVDNE